MNGGRSFPGILYLEFSYLFIGAKTKDYQIHRLIAGSAAISTLTPWFILDVVPKLMFPYYPQPGPLYVLLLSTFFIAFPKAFLLLYWNSRNLRLDYHRRIQSLLMCLGVFLPWLSVSTLFPLIYNVSITPQMGLFPLIFVSTVYTIVKYRFLNIRVIITRAGLLLAVYLMVLGLPFMVGSWGRSWLEVRFGEQWWLGPLGLCTVLATVGPFVYAYLRNQAEERLLKDQRRYQRLLQRAARGMTRVRSLRKLTRLIVRVVSRSVGVTHASLFLWQKDTPRYVLVASHGPKRLAIQSQYALETDDRLIQWMQAKRRVLSLDEMGPETDAAMTQALASLNASLIVPGFIEDELIGFLVMGEKCSGAGYSLDDLHAFSTLAHEAAIALENAKSYEELLKTNQQLRIAYDRLIDQERLAAAGQFAAGMAHEIKNPLTAIKTFAEFLPEKYDDPDFRQKFFRIVTAEIHRINDLVMELSDFAKPADPQLEQVPLADLLEDTVSLLSNQLLKQGIALQKAYPINGLAIRADPKQLKQLLLNILLNSLEAMPEGGRLEVATELRERWVTIRVTDTGCGIQPDQLAKVFDPFFTTKERGMGLGMAIVKGIVDRHAGRIAIRSHPGQGTTIEVELPQQVS